MADWTFYSPTMSFATAGELLKAIPSNRIWRLQRTFVESGKDNTEMVRAAELLLNLNVTLRLQNDPAAAMRLKVSEASDQHRREYSKLGRDGLYAADIEVVAEISLNESAVLAGHLDISDEAISGLEELYPGGVAHHAKTGELLDASELARVMDSDEQRCSHLDLVLHCEPAQRAYVFRQLNELPPPFGQYLRMEGDALQLRARFPIRLKPEHVDVVCHVALEMAQYAWAGHVRFREAGVWRDAVEGIGTRVSPPPIDGSEGLFRKLSRLLGGKK